LLQIYSFNQKQLSYNEVIRSYYDLFYKTKTMVLLYDIDIYKSTTRIYSV
jgi:uncharacterized protein (UPF0332 family)